MSILFYENANPWDAIIRKLIFTHHSILNNTVGKNNEHKTYNGQQTTTHEQRSKQQKPH
jgi:hypothetical protein